MAVIEDLDELVVRKSKQSTEFERMAKLHLMVKFLLPRGAATRTFNRWFCGEGF